MSRYKVYITDYDYDDIEIEKRILEPIGAEVVGLQCKDGTGIAEKAKDADALMVQYANIDEKTIKQLTNLKVIARYGVGTDIVDLVAAANQNVVCTNVVDYCNEEVADHNIAFILMLARRIPMFVEETKRGKWHWSISGKAVHRFSSLQIGTIGFGRIARNMCKKLLALGFQVVAYDPYVSSEEMEKESVRCLSFDELICSSDVVVLQCPYTDETHHIIGKAELDAMKEDAILVNCSRGKLVDNKSLYKALAAGDIAAAGLDDLEEEPAKKFSWSPDENLLFTLNNCFITPHVAYYSEQSLIEARENASRNVRAVLLGEEPPNRVY